MRYLGLDVGSHTIGIAVSDGLLLTAQGVETIRRKSFAKDLARISELVAELEITGLVVGLPKNMNGTLGEQARMSQEFAHKMQQQFPALEVVMWDERLTTLAAQKLLVEADVSRKNRKKVVDKLAAVLILQGYLDMLAAKAKQEGG